MRSIIAVVPFPFSLFLLYIAFCHEMKRKKNAFLYKGSESATSYCGKKKKLKAKMHFYTEGQIPLCKKKKKSGTNRPGCLLSFLASYY
jgi:hypothetical protein